MWIKNKSPLSYPRIRCKLFGTRPQKKQRVLAAVAKDCVKERCLRGEKKSSSVPAFIPLQLMLSVRTFY